jgi:NHLM bacteriocin system ABC transporter ATP-binding protein
LTLPADRPVAIGRAKENDLRLFDPSVSRRHARLFFQAGQVILQDLGSANGTLVNGHLLTTPLALQPGDRVQLGEFEFSFETSEDNQEPAVALVAQVILQLALDESGQLKIAGKEPTASDSLNNLTPELTTGVFPDQPGPKAATESPDPTLYTGSFAEICTTLGTTVKVGGNKPFLLADPASLWLVQSGRVEIFVVQVRQGQPTNARHYACSITPGQAFFGVNSELYGEGLGLLAVAGSNTTLLKLPVYHLHHMSQQPHLAETIAELVDNWVNALTTDITRLTLSGRNNLQLEPGQVLELAARQSAEAKKDGLWVSFQTGASLFLGEEELDPASADLYFPLYGTSWLQALANSKLTTASTTTLIVTPGLWSGLQLFYELYFRVKFNNIRLVTYDEINRLSRKTEYDHLAGQAALTELASIIGEVAAAPTERQSTNPDLLLAACRLVGQAQGIVIQDLAEEEEPLPGTSLLHEIARASRIRLRKVSLEAGWWSRDNGPLLGFKQESNHSVALLPLSGHAYEMVDPADGRRTRLTGRVAEALDSTAYVFYRPFPDKALKTWDLAKFGLRDCGNSLPVALLLGSAVGLLALLVPLITGYLFDSVIPLGQPDLLWQILLGLVVVAFSGLAFQLTRAISVLRLETKLGNSLQAAVWDRLLGMPAAFFRDYSVGDLAMRAMGIDQIQHLVGSNVINGLLSSLFSLFSFLLLFTYNFGLALVALGLTVITLLVITLVSLWQLRYQRRLAEKQGKISGLVLQLINGISKLRIAGAEVRAFRAWAGEFAGQRKLAFKARQIGNWLTVFNAAWPAITTLVIFAAVAGMSGQHLSTGAFLAFVVAFTQFLSGMIGMATALTTVLQAIPIYERTRIIFENLPETSTFKADPGELSGAIEVNHVSFRYQPDTPLILNDVSLQIKPGQFVAIVGPSGSGKSSLFRLLLGFETPEAGSIYYDNQNLANLKIQAVRRQMGVVLQSSKLIAGDIYENIVGSAPFTIEEAWEATKLAGIAQDIAAMPMNLFTVVSEGGSTLSGGQRQRLMIARAIIAKPRILLFDEATSALDNETQAIVSQSLESLRATRIVIAHRLSTIVNADCIYVLQGGKIVQSGKYAELINQDGPFRELASRQLA